MEENKIKETIEDLERTISGLRHEIDHTESLIELPTIRNRIWVLQKALDIARELHEAHRGTSNPSKDIFILKNNNKLEMAFFMDKLKEEFREVIKAYKNKDDDNFLEEIFDVLQVVVDILARLELNEIGLQKAIEMHNAKLKSRGFELEYAALSFNFLE
jgi:NTP pyrophosphatase (non-canonical NTP hydrolase)